MLVTSPDISSLDFSILYDISGATPAITLTNLSAGPDLAACHWWYDIITPSGTYIHQGSQGSPDKTGVWAPFVVPYTWPQPFGQIEWSGNDYVATLYVIDSDNNTFSVTYRAGICRPHGNTSKTVGNFAEGNLIVNTRCETANLYVDDTTDYTYKEIFGTSVSKAITLVYPPNEDGSIPAPVTLSDVNSGLFPIQFNGVGYIVMMNAVRSYALSANVTVKIKYKTRNEFAVRCNIDLCALTCEIDKMLTNLNATCGQNIDPATQTKLLKINSLLLKAVISKQQPLCGYDVAAIVDEIIEIGGFTCNCLSGGTGINGNITGDISVTVNGTCGDIAGQAVVTGSNIILNLQDISYKFVLCDGIPTDAFSIDESYDSGTCTKTFCLNVDLTTLANDLPIPHTGNICVPVYEHGVTTTPPTACPNSFYPAYIYNYANNAVIGYSNSPTDTVAILNADSTWNIKGVAIVAGNCTVCFVPDNGVTSINPVYVAPDTGGNPPSPANYAVQVQDYCQAPALQPLNSFPQNIYVAYTNGGTRYYAGLAADYNDMITKLNAESHKPGYITINAVSNTNPLSISIGVVDANTPANKHVNVYGDKTNVVLIGGNSHFGNPTGTTDAMNEIYPDSMSRIGDICSTQYPGGIPEAAWHTALVGNTLLRLDSQGHIASYDVSNPLVPTFSTSNVFFGITGPGLNVPFSGIPGYGGGVRSDWDVYFPTDVNAQTQGSIIYVVESTSGTIYKYDYITNTVIGAFYSVNLLGACPRVIYNNKLYLTLDGNRGALTGVGATNPIPADSIIICDLGLFGTSAFSATQIATGVSVWAMVSDPANPSIAYITTTNGNVYRYNMFNDVVTDTYASTTPTLAAASLINNYIFNGRLFISAYGVGTYQIQLSTLGGSAIRFDTLTLPVGGTNINHFNFIMLPNSCYGILTFDNGTSNGGVAKYGFDGNFLGLISIPGSIYNVVYKYGVPSATPNSLCP